jgi:uncharacterized protein (DUF924 family)
MATPEDVLDFWYGEPATNEDALLAKIQRWFAGGPALDAEIEERFGADVERALEGELDDWAESPRGLLALVLVLDQFPRSIHRDSPRAFAGDARALALARRALADGSFRELDWEGRHFLLTPFLHQEDPSAQDEGLAQFIRAHDEAPELNKLAFAAGIEQANKYGDVVRRFGRFPHRNAVLGRASTPAEIAFLKDWAQAASPAIMARKPASG